MPAPDSCDPVFYTQCQRTAAGAQLVNAKTVSAELEKTKFVPIADQEIAPTFLALMLVGTQALLTPTVPHKAVSFLQHLDNYPLKVRILHGMVKTKSLSSCEAARGHTSSVNGEM